MAKSWVVGAQLFCAVAALALIIAATVMPQMYIVDDTAGSKVEAGLFEVKVTVSDNDNSPFFDQAAKSEKPLKCDSARVRSTQNAKCDDVLESRCKFGKGTGYAAPILVGVAIIVSAVSSFYSKNAAPLSGIAALCFLAAGILLIMLIVQSKNTLDRDPKQSPCGTGLLDDDDDDDTNVKRGASFHMFIVAASLVMVLGVGECVKLVMLMKNTFFSYSMLDTDEIKLISPLSSP